LLEEDEIRDDNPDGAADDTAERLDAGAQQASDTA
jgi:hypothetical protein